MPEADPKQKLTTWQTGLGMGKETSREAVKDHLDRSRMIVTGQMEWIHAWLSLDDPYFTGQVLDDLLMMMAHKGSRAEEVTYSLAHQYDHDMEYRFGGRLHEVDEAGRKMMERKNGR